jgi:hypothetical protein
MYYFIWNIGNSHSFASDGFSPLPGSTRTHLVPKQKPTKRPSGCRPKKQIPLGDIDNFLVLQSIAF